MLMETVTILKKENERLLDETKHKIDEESSKDASLSNQ